MQQLFAAFGIDWRLLLIQGINFALLLFLLSRYLFKPMMRIIDERRAKIAEGIAAGERAERELAAAKEESEGIVGSAAREAEGLVASARKNAEERSLGIVRAAEEKAHALLLDAAAQAEESKRRALEESKQQIARAAVLAAEKILIQKHS